jgi:hypothetical protein
MVVLLVIGVAGAGAMALISKGRLDTARNENKDNLQAYADTVATAKYAETVIASATTVDRDLKLADAMSAHNTVYPDLYAELFHYIPSFYRVTSMRASAGGEDTSTVQIDGELQSFKQYADVALALWRIPDVTSVSRAGFTGTSTYVPALSEQDQTGTPIKQGETPLPSDVYDRMNALSARANAEPQGFLNVGNFGTTESSRGAMPGWSTVTMVITIKKNLQTPDPHATIAGGGGGGGTGLSGMPTGFAGGGPSTPKGGGPSTPKSSSAPAPPASSGDDEEKVQTRRGKKGADSNAD